MTENKETKMYVIDYTDMDGENLRTIVTNAPNPVIAWEKVAEYVGLPCKCVGCTRVQSGMWVVG